MVVPCLFPIQILTCCYGIDINNTLEGTWETIKNKWGASFACRTIESLFKALVGVPGDRESHDLSWFSKRCTQFENIFRGRQRVGGGYKRHRTLLALRRFIALANADPSAYVRDVDGVDPHG